MFKVNNKNTIATSLTSFWFLIVNFEHMSLFPGVFIVDFEQLNVIWVKS